jgi:hypothetical protein
MRVYQHQDDEAQEHQPQHLADDPAAERLDDDRDGMTNSPTVIISLPHCAVVARSQCASQQLEVS